MAKLVAVLKAISSEPRLKILRLLKERPLCVNAITAHIGCTQSAVSQHLCILKQAGLVKAEKQGCWMHYSVDRKSLKKWRAAMDKLLS